MEILLSDSHEDMLTVGTNKVIISVTMRCTGRLASECSVLGVTVQTPATATISQSAGEHQCPHHRNINTLQLNIYL